MGDVWRGEVGDATDAWLVLHYSGLAWELRTGESWT
jgi:hypothetical protein